MEFRQLIKLYLDEKIKIAQDLEIDNIDLLINKVLDCYRTDGTVFLAANGGPVGAIDSFATDLRTHPFVLDDKSISTNIRRLRVVNLCESTSLISGISNDVGFNKIFSEQLKNYLRSNINIHDVFIAFSGSGNSQNIIDAFTLASKYGVYTACISGRDGGKLKEISNNCILIPGSSKFPGQTGKNDNNFHIEDFQVSITHMITGILKLKINNKA